MSPADRGFSFESDSTRRCCRLPLVVQTGNATPLIVHGPSPMNTP